jgi:multisubunit Na+/H+ antiporter MnhB subunit
MVSLFLPAPATFLGTYLFYEGGTLLIILLIFLWDWKNNRVMKQFLEAAALVVAVGLTGTWLYFNATWQAITNGWLVAWTPHI